MAGFDSAFAHLGDPADLEYEVVVGGYVGDWEAAAELYRSWALSPAVGRAAARVAG